MPELEPDVYHEEIWINMKEDITIGLPIKVGG